MFKKISELVKSTILFWKKFFKSDSKKAFLATNSGAIKTHTIVLLGIALVTVVAYHAIKPVVRGGCKIILKSDNQESLMQMMDRVASVEAKKVSLGTTLKQINSIGILKANLEAVIKSEINGKVSKIAFKEGSEVKKGDILIEFEDDGLKAEVAKWEAEYDLRKIESDRQKGLFSKKSTSLQAVQKAEAEMKSSKAQLDNAKFQLTKAVISAPFDGKIGILKNVAYPGNIISPQTELVYLVNTSKITVEFMVPAKYVEEVAEGQSVDVSVDAFPDKSFSGIVEAIDSEIDTKNHSILVKAVIDNDSELLQHGMFASVKLTVGEKNNVVLVDEDCVDREGQHEFVWIIDDKGRAYRRAVITGSKDESGVEIISGLKEGEIVVTAGQLKLTDGKKVKILNQELNGANSTLVPAVKTEEQKGI